MNAPADYGTREEIARLQLAKRELEASSRVVHKAWRIATRVGVSQKQLARLKALKETVYQELDDLTLLLRLLAPEE